MIWFQLALGCINAAIALLPGLWPATRILNGVAAAILFTHILIQVV